jgi:hypothetical protein
MSRRIPKDPRDARQTHHDPAQTGERDVIRLRDGAVTAPFKPFAILVAWSVPMLNAT